MRIGKQDNAVTSICTSDATSITVRGMDLCSEVIGHFDFTSYFWLLVTGARPSEDQLFFTNAMLVALADIIGVMGGWLVSVFGLGFDSTVYLRNTLDFVTTNDILAGLIKAVVFGGVIAIMGCYQGDRSQAGATGVGRAATLSMVGAAVLILAFNYVMSTVFVEIGL